MQVMKDSNMNTWHIEHQKQMYRQWCRNRKLDDNPYNWTQWLYERSDSRKIRNHANKAATP